MINQVSFTQKIKEELVSVEYNDEQLKCILSGFTQINGRIIIANKKSNIILTTENAKIAKMLYVTFQKLYNVDPRFSYSRRMKFDKKVCFNIIVEENADIILDDLQVSLYSANPTKTFLRKEDNARCFLVGVFLATGSCNDPISSNYHLEISASDEDVANYINKLMNRSNPVSFQSKIIKRRTNYVIYLKKSDRIVDFLAYLGAHSCCLDFEEVRVERDFRNNDNRLQICENANVYRTIISAQKQMEEIKLIDRVMGIKNIPNVKMKTLCFLRLENEELSMQELANLLGHELEMKVSKSNVNHLFRAIHKLAERFENK